MNKPKLFIFNWPGFVGGADTKVAHLILLLHDHADITVVPNESRHLHDKVWTQFLDNLEVRYSLFSDLPLRLDGFALSMCNDCFFINRIAHRAKERGLTVIWSSEMMWHHRGEIEGIKQGVVDKVLYTSEFQKEALARNYGNLPSAVTGNYIDPLYFPFKERTNQTFTIGRLSRAVPEKYPEDFPVFYEGLEIPEVHFRVMAWDEQLRQKYGWHKFDSRWEFLTAGAEPQLQFLYSLDLFVYTLGHTFRESWGRSVVESMLTGCIPLVPSGHQFEKLIVHGETGFICEDFIQFKEHANTLYYDLRLRRHFARRCHDHAIANLCDREQHLQKWLQVFT